MRDPAKLKAFHLADDLALHMYKATATFPRHEQFGLTTQMRKAAVSIPSNIVEGCGRDTQGDYVHFLDISYASACELQYQVSLAHRLGYLKKAPHDTLQSKCTETCKVLNALIRSLRQG